MADNSSLPRLGAIPFKGPYLLLKGHIVDPTHWETAELVTETTILRDRIEGLGEGVDLTIRGRDDRADREIALTEISEGSGEIRAVLQTRSGGRETEAAEFAHRTEAARTLVPPAA